MPDLHETINQFLEGSIATIGRAPVIESKSITENGTYTAPSGVDGYSPITVNVPTPTPVIESKSITANGTYTAPEGVDGYSPITVNVPTTTPIIESKSITENGTYTAPSGVDGYSPITVNVPSTAKKLFNMNMTKYSENSMSYNFDLDHINIIWNGGSQIGSQLYGLVNLRNYTKIKASGHATTSYWQTNPQDMFKLALGISSVMATSPSQVSAIYYEQSAPVNEDFTIEIDIPADTDCYMFFTCSGYNIQNLQIEVM